MKKCVEPTELYGEAVMAPGVGGNVICLDSMNLRFSGDVAHTTASLPQQESLLKMGNQ